MDGDLAAKLESEGRLLEALEAYADANRRQRDASVERHLVRLRQAAFGCLDRSVPPPAWPPPVASRASTSDGPPVVSPSELTAERLRSGIFGHGSLLVRGLVPSARVRSLRDAID